jgi:hypothetical protein
MSDDDEDGIELWLLVTIGAAAIIFYWLLGSWLI